MPLKRKPKKSSSDLMPHRVPELVYELLRTINIFEGANEAHLRPIVAKLRDAHLDLKNVIGCHPDYQDNKGLRRLDKAYADAFWSNNGLRWTKEKPDDESEDIFLVRFTNRRKTAWQPV